MLNVKRFLWFHFWYHRYYYFNKIKDFFTLKANKRVWHSVIVTNERYPEGFMSANSTARLFWDGEEIQRVNYPIDISKYSISVWFNTKNNLPFLGIDPA